MLLFGREEADYIIVGMRDMFRDGKKHGKYGGYDKCTPDSQLVMHQTYGASDSLVSFCG